MTLNNWCLLLRTGIPLTNTNNSKRNEFTLNGRHSYKTQMAPMPLWVTFMDRNSCKEKTIYTEGDVFIFDDRNLINTQISSKETSLRLGTGIPIPSTNDTKGNVLTINGSNFYKNANETKENMLTFMDRNFYNEHK